MDRKELNQKIVTGTIWKFGELTLAQGVSFLVSLVLARILMPEDYGVVSIIQDKYRILWAIDDKHEVCTLLFPLGILKSLVLMKKC